MRKKNLGKRLIASALALVLAGSINIMSVPSVTEAATDVMPEREGEEGCKEIPGTTSTFDRYNSSFMSVTGFAKDGVKDRSAYIGTSYHRQVRTAKELAQAIYDASTKDGKESTVKVIEIICDINIGYGKMSGLDSTVLESVVRHDTIKMSQCGYTNPLLSEAGGVTQLQIKHTDGLTIFSRYGATLEFGGFDIQETSNDVVIRNLKIDGCWQWDNTAHHKETGWTCVKVNATNVWLDHCEFTMAGDGCVDMESGANGITYSWCKFGIDPDEALDNPSIVASINYMESLYQKDLEAIAAGTQKEGEFLNCDINTIDSEHIGNRYSKLRQAGATPEEIMYYTAYHSKVNLCGSGDKDYAVNEKMRISLAYNFYQSVGQRIPMIRQGTGHMYNCVVDNAKHAKWVDTFKEKYGLSGDYTLSRCINARNGASIGADTCIFNISQGAITGAEYQGNDTANMSDTWALKFSNAYNHALIVNSKVTNTQGKSYTGSSWDKEGITPFTENAESFWHDKSTIKKWAWSSELVNPSETQSVFEIKYNYDEKLPYEYQLVPLTDVEEVVKSYSGMGIYDLTPAQWCMTTYAKDCGIEPAGENKVQIAKEVKFADTNNWNGDVIVAYVGDKLTFDLTTKPAKITNPVYEWSVNKNAEIDPATGEFTATKNGIATVKVKITSVNGETVMCSQKVQIKPASEKPAAPVVSGGAGEATDGSTEVTDGSTDVTDGSTEVTDGSTDVTDGSTEVTDGSTEVTDGSTDVTDGSTEVTDGSTEVTDGSTEVTDGPTDVTDGPTDVTDDSVKPTDDFKAGDADCNGKVDLVDAKNILKLSLGIEIKITGQGKKNADYDKSGKIDLNDAKYTLKDALGIPVTIKK